jgi:hypothetical protein
LRDGIDQEIRRVHVRRARLAQHLQEQQALLARALVDDLPLFHQNQVVEQVEDLALGLVDGANDRADALGGEVFQRRAHGERGGGVEARGGLILE